MNLFKKVKANVAARQAAERYDLKMNRSGMACCPFHDDRAPSMKLDARYYCFGCGATGDAVDLTSKLLGLPPKEAALQLASDFGIDDPADQAIRILTDYLWKLRDWKENHAPPGMNDNNWHPLFCEALDKRIFIEYVLDELLAAGESDHDKLRRAFGKEVERVEKRLERYAA